MKIVVVESPAKAKTINKYLGKDYKDVYKRQGYINQTGGFVMSGTIRMFLAIAVFIAAGYGVAFLWTGQLPPYAIEVAGTLGVLLVLAIIVTVITKPAGEKH